MLQYKNAHFYVKIKIKSQKTAIYAPYYVKNIGFVFR